MNRVDSTALSGSVKELAVLVSHGGRILQRLDVRDALNPNVSGVDIRVQLNYRELPIVRVFSDGWSSDLPGDGGQLLRNVARNHHAEFIRHLAQEAALQASRRRRLDALFSLQLRSKGWRESILGHGEKDSRQGSEQLGRASVVETDSHAAVSPRAVVAAAHVNWRAIIAVYECVVGPKAERGRDVDSVENCNGG